jgi:mannose-6-phosphate isomerase-like protein (cupin superfamily)
MTRPQIKLIEPRDLGPRDWGTEELIAQGDGYIGKKLTMKAATAGGLQFHERKDESFLLVEGRAMVEFDDGLGGLASIHLKPGMMVHVPPGAPHRVTAFTECVFYEWSNPVFNDRVRVEKEYNEPDVDGLPTTTGS